MSLDLPPLYGTAHGAAHEAVEARERVMLARIAQLEAELEQAHAAVLYYITIKSGLEAERDAAREEAERNRVNAERYEWLRNKAESTNDDMPIVAARTPQDTTMLVAGKLDAAIDAARRKP